jgi:DNA-directed RNA polymerase specialized sigma24 family protein
MAPVKRFLAVIDAAQHRGSFGGPRTWLYGIARNVIAAESRRSMRERRAESLADGTVVFITTRNWPDF